MKIFGHLRSTGSRRWGFQMKFSNANIYAYIYIDVSMQEQLREMQQYTQGRNQGLCPWPRDSSAALRE